MTPYPHDDKLTVCFISYGSLYGSVAFIRSYGCCPTLSSTVLFMQTVHVNGKRNAVSRFSWAVLGLLHWAVIGPKIYHLTTFRKTNRDPQPPTHPRGVPTRRVENLGGGGGAAAAAEAPEQRGVKARIVGSSGIPSSRTNTGRGVRPEAREMTQKQTLFKGQSKKKTVPPNRHGKAPHVRKGMRAGTDCGAPHS